MAPNPMLLQGGITESHSMNIRIGLAMAIGLTLSPAVAYATCSETNGRLITRFEDAVNARIDYLLCLHNEQVTSLNHHSDMIGSVSDYVIALDERVRVSDATSAGGTPLPGGEVSLAILRDVAARYDTMERENADLRRRVQALEVHLSKQ